jgi:hypothetical protein
MADRKWHQKATVQAAIVNGIPAMLTAVIAIFAIFYTCNAAKTQLAFDKQQAKRDSVNSELQFQLLLRQLELANKTFYSDSIINTQQLLIAEENLRILLVDVKNKNTANWGKLRNTMWEIIDITTTSGREGYASFEKLSIEDKIKKANKIWSLLNAEIDNPVLISNNKCLGYWRNAISKAKFLTDSNSYSLTKFSDQISSLMSDVFFVWSDLVLHSKEISPTGGKPK